MSRKITLSEFAFLSSDFKVKIVDSYLRPVYFFTKISSARTFIGSVFGP